MSLYSQKNFIRMSTKKVFKTSATLVKSIFKPKNTQLELRLFIFSLFDTKYKEIHHCRFVRIWYKINSLSLSLREYEAEMVRKAS